MSLMVKPCKNYKLYEKLSLFIWANKNGRFLMIHIPYERFRLLLHDFPISNIFFRKLAQLTINSHDGNTAIQDNCILTKQAIKEKST